MEGELNQNPAETPHRAAGEAHAESGRSLVSVQIGRWSLVLSVETNDGEDGTARLPERLHVRCSYGASSSSSSSSSLPPGEKSTVSAADTVIVGHMLLDCMAGEGEEKRIRVVDAEAMENALILVPQERKNEGKRKRQESEATNGQEEEDDDKRAVRGKRTKLGGTDGKAPKEPPTIVPQEGSPVSAAEAAEADGEDLVNGLPSELLELIFSYLPPHQLLRLSTVCRLWHLTLTCNESLWHLLHRIHFGPVPPLDPVAAAPTRFSGLPLWPKDSDWRQKCTKALRLIESFKSDYRQKTESERDRYARALKKESRTYNIKRYVWASMRNYVQLIRKWLAEEDEEDVHDFMQEGLVQAARNGAKEVVELYLDMGIGLHGETKFLQEAFLSACACGQTPIVGLMLDHRLSFDEGLIRAATQGHVEVVQLLLKSGIPVDTRDARMRTPLMRAAATNSVAVVEELVKHGADLEAVDSNGQTPLIHTLVVDAVDAARVLHQHGANKHNAGRWASSPAELVLERSQRLASGLWDFLL